MIRGRIAQAPCRNRESHRVNKNAVFARGVPAEVRRHGENGARAGRPVDRATIAADNGASP